MTDMNIICNDRERIFLDGTAEEWAALESHAATCTSCGEELRSWKNLSVAAADLHQEWDSPALWPRIEQVLAQESHANNSGWQRFFARWNFGALQWQTALAAALLLAVSGFAVWIGVSGGMNRIPENQALLNNKTVREVERAEVVYERAIDKLDSQARPQLGSRRGSPGRVRSCRCTWTGPGAAGTARGGTRRG